MGKKKTKEEKDDFDKYLEKQMKDAEFKKAYIAEIENRIKDLFADGKNLRGCLSFRVVSEEEAQKRLNWHKKKKDI